MEELQKKETQTKKTQKKEAPLGLKIFVIGGFICFAFIFIFVSTYTSKPLTSAEIAQINASKKTDFLNFESQVYSIPKQCDADYTEASKLLLKDGQKAISKFNDAHYSCLDTFNQIQNVNIPDSLSDAQIKSLKSAIGDLTTAYASKRGASESAYKFLTTGDNSKINKAKDEIELSQENLLKGMFKIKEVEKELKISEK